MEVDVNKKRSMIIATFFLCQYTTNLSEEISMPKQTAFTLTSAAFDANMPIPAIYTCSGENISPELTWTDAPPETKSFALIVDDPDAAHGTWVHWVVFNLPAHITTLPKQCNIESLGGTQGKTSFDKAIYGGPCPPNGMHHYHFKLYALDTVLTINQPVSKEVLLKAMEGHVLASTELIGTYQK
jgi:Raf kinase inhibitor-like YbhB/YbcL family protein